MEWNAVARIDLGDRSHGTGFLISSELNLVMTAFHVVADRPASTKKGEAVWRKGPIKLTFGNPALPATQWTTEGRVDLAHFSIDHDWLILKVDEVKSGVVAARLAKLERTKLKPRHEFKAIGFPTMRVNSGGVLTGTVLDWEGDECQVDAENLEADAKGGENAGGISGGPIIIDGAVSAIVVRALAAPSGGSVTRSLFVKPIEFARRSLVGRVPWDDNEPVPLQTVVESKLPNDDDSKLADAARVIHLPGVRTRTPIARRLLGMKLDDAWPAINACNLEPRDAAPIIDSIAAMAFNAEAIAGLNAASAAKQIGIIGSSDPRLFRWYVQRAFDVAHKPVPRERIFVLHREANAAEVADDAFDAICVDLRRTLTKRKIRPPTSDILLSKDLDTRVRAWLVLVNENRPDLLQRLRDELPNFITIVGEAEPTLWPPPHDALARPIVPRLSSEAITDLILSWQEAATQLDVPDELESDDR